MRKKGFWIIFILIMFLLATCWRAKAEGNQFLPASEETEVTIWGRASTFDVGEEIVISLTNGRFRQVVRTQVTWLPSPPNFIDDTEIVQVKGYLAAFRICSYWGTFVSVSSEKYYRQLWRWPFWPFGTSWRIDF